MPRARLARFLKDEDGAVTVDWVALTGAMVGLAVLIVLDIAEGATNVSGEIGAELSNSHISDITFLVTPPEQTSGSGSSETVAP
jgi:Flp pilus assembly pilin Flp